MIDPKKELLKWGPIDGRPIYVDAFMQAFVAFVDYWKMSWPDIFGYTKNDKTIFIADYESIRDVGEVLFKKFILDEEKRKANFREWQDYVKKIKRIGDIVNKGLEKLSDDELKGLFISFSRAEIDFWVRGFLPELSNWGGERLLKNNILKFGKENFIGIFEKLSAPEDMSFFQKEELELMKIKLVDGKEQLQRLKEHQKRWYWLRNSYAFTKVIGVDFFEKRLVKISQKEAEKKIKEINQYHIKTKKEKQRLIKKYKISEDTADIAHNLSYTIWWQDYRKQFIFIANHIITSVLKEISERKKISFKELCYYTLPEIKAILENNKQIDAKERFDGFNTYYHENDGITYLTGEKANEFVRPYVEVEIDSGIKEFKGIVVSMGNSKIKGKVKILLTPKNVNKMDDGEILVAPMTSPDYIIAMRKSAAIITDEGGMTSHAAIVSRELGLPCIVGTKIATKVLKDGDVVEVNADKGIVKILK